MLTMPRVSLEKRNKIMTDTTEGATVEGSPANTTPVVETTTGDEQSAADETTEGGITVGPDSMD